MTAQSNAPNVIIKKVKKVQGGGHHGGAWKVAYADFVTAMMAFFLLMWLLNATTEKQRKGIADYFSPTIPASRVSGGGDGAFGGDSVFTEETLARNGMGGAPGDPGESAQPDRNTDAETEQLKALEEMLTGASGESMVSDDVLRHIVTKVTDEGLLIELFDIEGDPLFYEGSDPAQATHARTHADDGRGVCPGQESGGDRRACAIATAGRGKQPQLGALRSQGRCHPQAARRGRAGEGEGSAGDRICRPQTGHGQPHGHPQQPHRPGAPALGSVRKRIGFYLLNAC